jgi:CheY-like chemotaxis protein
MTTTKEPMPRNDPHPTRKPTKHRVVLCVDDDSASASLMKAVLDYRAEIEFLAASTAEQALALARSRQPDLMLVDLGLPDRPGTELIRELREDPRTRAVRIIVVSALDPRDELVPPGAWIDAQVRKPVDDVKGFIELVDSVLARKPKA